jgi:hypothetical protein
MKMRGMKMSKVWALMALAGAMAIPAAAQRPDLSGTWKLNVAKSLLAGDHPDKDYQLTKIIVQKASLIRQTDIAMHVSMMNIPLPDSKVTMELAANGQEVETNGASPFPGMPGVKMKVVAEWQGGTLLVTEAGRTFGGLSTTQRRYFLSDDGLQLIELIEGHSGFGDTAQRLVFEKQP